MPQTDWARWSAAISRRRASAPCDQPNLAPVTIQACWYRKWLTFAVVGCGWARSQASSRRARSVSGISSSGSFGAPETTNAGVRLAGAVFFVGAAFFVGTAFLAGAACCFAAFGADGTTGAATGSGLASVTAVPRYGERSSGSPVSGYFPRVKVTLTTGAPVSISLVPAAGVWVATLLAE